MDIYGSGGFWIFLLCIVLYGFCVMGFYKFFVGISFN